MLGRERLCLCAHACVSEKQGMEEGWWCLTSSIKGAFQLHWKQFPAEGTFILKLCLASTDCSCVRQSSQRARINCPSSWYILGQAAISKSVLKSLLIFERPVPAQSDTQYVLRELEGQRWDSSGPRQGRHEPQSSHPKVKPHRLDVPAGSAGLQPSHTCLELNFSTLNFYHVVVVSQGITLLCFKDVNGPTSFCAGTQLSVDQKQCVIFDWLHVVVANRGCSQWLFS